MAKQAMPADKKAALVAVGDSLRASPKAWNEIGKSSKDTIKELLRPGTRGFSEDQRQFVRFWYVEVDQAVVDAINAAMPPYHRVEPRMDKNGKLFLSSDLFTDADDNGPLKAILPIIEKIKLKYKLDDEWPVADEEI